MCIRDRIAFDTNYSITITVNSLLVHEKPCFDPNIYKSYCIERRRVCLLPCWHKYLISAVPILPSLHLGPCPPACTTSFRENSQVSSLSHLFLMNSLATDFLQSLLVKWKIFLNLIFFLSLQMSIALEFSSIFSWLPGLTVNQNHKRERLSTNFPRDTSIKDMIALSLDCCFFCD